MKKLFLSALALLTAFYLCACGVSGGGWGTQINTGDEKENSQAQNDETPEPKQKNEPSEKENALAEENKTAEKPAPNKSDEKKPEPAEPAQDAQPVPAAPSEYGLLSNTLAGWGFRRVLPDRPEFTAKQIQLMQGYGCIYMGASDEKVLYLTFDEGYENGYTASILDTLKEKGVKAAFFITGAYLRAKDGEALIRRMLDEGHIVGNHSNTHPSLPSLSSVSAVEEEILSLDRQFYGIFGMNMKYLRPPRGEYSEKTLAITRDLGYTNVLWSLAYRDWETDKQKGVDHAYKQVMDNLHNGCVMLLHAVSSDNAGALGKIIDDARAQGYAFKTLDEYK